MFTAKQKNKFIDFLEKYCRDNNILITKDIIRQDKKIKLYLIRLKLKTDNKEEFIIRIKKEIKNYILCIDYKKIDKYWIGFFSLKEFETFEKSGTFETKTKDFIKALIDILKGE